MNPILIIEKYLNTAVQQATTAPYGVDGLDITGWAADCAHELGIPTIPNPQTVGAQAEAALAWVKQHPNHTLDEYMEWYESQQQANTHRPNRSSADPEHPTNTP